MKTNMPENFLFVVKIFLAGFSLFVAALFARAGCNYEHERAVNSFSRWTKELGIEYKKYSCQFNDGDDNGYVTCDYIDLKDQRLEVECNSDWLNNYRQTGGCRNPKPSFKVITEVHNHNKN